MTTSSLETSLAQKTGLNLEDIQEIAAHFKLQQTKRGQRLETEGQVCRHFYFIEKGCLRLYEIDNKGNEITAFFALEDGLITALPSFITQKPSKDFLVSLEPCTLRVIHRDAFFALTEQFPAFRTLYNEFVEFAFIHSQMRIYSFLGMEGIEKLRWVMEHEPKLLSRVSSKAVASYLGMTNSTLSKLRAKL